MTNAMDIPIKQYQSNRTRHVCIQIDANICGMTQMADTEPCKKCFCLKWCVCGCLKCAATGFPRQSDRNWLSAKWLWAFHLSVCKSAHMNIVKLLRFIAFGQFNTEVHCSAEHSESRRISLHDAVASKHVEMTNCYASLKHPRKCWICAPQRIPHRNAQFHGDIFFFKHIKWISSSRSNSIGGLVDWWGVGEGGKGGGGI